jgi:hypothetical protein
MPTRRKPLDCATYPTPNLAYNASAGVPDFVTSGQTENRFATKTL